jgi:hypothetical protein
MELISGSTWYSDHIEDRMAAAAMDPDWGENWWDIPHPEWVLGSDRVETAITKLQKRFKAWKKRQTIRRDITAAIADAKRFSGGILQDWQVHLLKSLWLNRWL